VYAVVVRSTFPSQNVQNSVGPLLEVEMSKKWTVQSTPASEHFLKVIEKVHAVAARSTFGSQNVQKNTTSGPLLKVQSDVACQK